MTKPQSLLALVNNVSTSVCIESQAEMILTPKLEYNPETTPLTQLASYDKISPTKQERETVTGTHCPSRNTVNRER